jgi:hypothetical protein
LVARDSYLFDRIQISIKGADELPGRFAGIRAFDFKPPCTAMRLLWNSYVPFSIEAGFGALCRNTQDRKQEKGGRRKAEPAIHDL